MSSPGARGGAAVSTTPDEIELILRIGLQISSEHDLSRLLRLTVESIKNALGHSYCAILLKEGNDLVIRAVTEYPEGIIGRRIPLGEGISGRCALSRTESLVPDLSECGQYIHLGEGVFRSEADIPIIFRDKVLGVLNTQSTRANAFGEGDLHVLRILGNQIGVALHNSQVRAQLELVQDIGIQLVTIRRTEELFPAIVRQVRERLHYDSCAILRAEEGALVVAAATDEFPKDSQGRRIPIGRGVTGRCALEKRVIVVGDVRHDPAYISSGFADARSEIASPILFRDQLLGVMSIESRTEEAFDEDDVRLLSILSAQVAVGLHNARMYAEVEKMAVTDALTGLYNYRYFHDRLTGETTRSTRYGHPLSLVMVDLDNFKEINDRHGHLKGDEVLKEVAQTLKRNIRRCDETVIMREAELDVASRYGGEEFVIIMPDTGSRGAAIAAERLRKHVEAEVARQVGLAGAADSPGRVTGSFGVATHRKGEDTESFIKRADEATYAAKRAGKNVVFVIE